MGLVFSSSSGNRESAQTYIQNGRALLRQHKDIQAEAMFQRAIDADDQCSDAYFWMAKTQRFLKKNQEDVLKLCNKAIEYAPNDLTALRFKAAVIAETTEDANAEAAVDLQVRDSKAKTGHDFLAKSYAYLDIDEKQSSKMLDKAIKLIPKEAGFHFVKAERLAVSNPKQSLKEVEIALKLDPLFVDVWTLKGDILNKMGDKAGALKSYEKALSTTPHDMQILENKYMILSKSGEYQKALDVAFTMLEIAPDDSGVANNISGTYTCLHDFNNALHFRNKAIELKPNNEFYYLARGNLYVQLGMYKEASADYTKGYRLFKEHGENTEGHSQEFIKTSLTYRSELLEQFSELSETKIEQIDVATIYSFDKAEAEVLNKEAVVLQAKNKALMDRMPQLFESKAEEMSIAAILAELQAIKQQNVYYQARLDAIEAPAKYMRDLHYTPKLWDYHDGLMYALSCAYTVSGVTMGGVHAVNTSNTLVTMASGLASMAPMVGNAASKMINGVYSAVTTAGITKAASKVSSIASNSEECSKLVMHLSMKLTIHPNKLDEIEHVAEQPVIEAGTFGALWSKLKGFGEEFKVKLNGERYKSPESKLGRDDALKVLAAIENDQIAREPGDTFEDLVHKFYHCVMGGEVQDEWAN